MLHRILRVELSFQSALLRRYTLTTNGDCRTAISTSMPIYTKRYPPPSPSDAGRASLLPSGYIHSLSSPVRNTPRTGLKLEAAASWHGIRVLHA